MTFGAIGFMILQDPVGWGAMLQPWAAALVPGSLTAVMRQTGVLDIAVGLFLLSPRTAWAAALVGAVHVLIVLITTGINVITIRDVAILGASAALFLETVPPALVRKFGRAAKP